MAGGRPCIYAIILACIAASPGCAQPGPPILAHHTTVGTLKASVSKLQFEKESLEKQVTDLTAENRRAEERLAQEEEANGELTARLDDARVLLRTRGYDPEAFSAPARSPGSSDDEAPRGEKPRRTRKPPVARIPARIDPVNSSDGTLQGTDPFDSPTSSSAAPTTGAQSQSQRRSRSGWMPVASGDDITGGRVR
jgi:hypothetical protein